MLLKVLLNSKTFSPTRLFKKRQKERMNNIEKISYKINKEIETKDAVENYIGKTFKSKNYGSFKVLGCYDKYITPTNNKTRYVVEFLDTGFQTISFGNRIRSGDVRDYMYPNVCGVGYVGDCSYEDEPSKHFLYSNWRSMIQRCYDENCKEYRPNGSVASPWHCFMNFTEDSKSMIGYSEMKNNPDIKFVIDKDFLFDMNQKYFKDICVFMPQKINSFIMNMKKNRKYNFEGFYVDISNKNAPFRAQVKFRTKTLDIGRFSDPINAHEAFWKKKTEIATQYINEDYPFMSTELRNVIYAKIIRREQYSLSELKRAVLDRYFDEWLK